MTNNETVFINNWDFLQENGNQVEIALDYACPYCNQTFNSVIRVEKSQFDNSTGEISAYLTCFACEQSFKVKLLYDFYKKNKNLS